MAQAGYDLGRLCRNGLIIRRPHANTYDLTLTTIQRHIDDRLASARMPNGSLTDSAHLSELSPQQRKYLRHSPVAE
jgi:hypothetical protein